MGFSSLILVGDGGGILWVRSMMVGEGFATQRPVGLGNRVNLVFLGGISTKVTYFFIAKGCLTNCCD